MVAPSRGATSWTTPGMILCMHADEEDNTCNVHQGCGRGMRGQTLLFIPNPAVVLRILLYHREGSLCTHSVPIPTLLKVSAVVSCCTWALRPALRCPSYPSRVPRRSGGRKPDRPSAAAFCACVAMTPCTSITTLPTTPRPIPP